MGKHKKEKKEKRRHERQRLMELEKRFSRQEKLLKKLASANTGPLSSSSSEEERTHDGDAPRDRNGSQDRDTSRDHERVRSRSASRGRSASKTRDTSRSGTREASTLRESSPLLVSPKRKRPRSLSPGRGERRVLVQSPRRDSDVEQEEQDDTEKQQIDPELQELLWKRQTAEKVFAPPVIPELEVRLNEVGRMGLPTTDLRELLTRYPVIENCKAFIPPVLNAEVAETLPERERARDQRLVLKQEKTASLLTAISQPLGQLFQANRREDKAMVAPLLDAARLAADMFFEESKVRKFLAVSHLNKSRQKVLLAIPSDEFLFGKNLAESLRSAKAVSQSIAELRPTSSTPKNERRPPPRPLPPRQGARGGPKPRQQQAPPRRPAAPRPTYRPPARQPQQKRKRSVSRRR